MSEKCPCCGREGGIIHYPDDMGCGWFCGNGDCSFSCNPADLPRIAAAMELAKAKQKREKIGRNIFGDWDEYDEKLWQAERRVLEVFEK